MSWSVGFVGKPENVAAALEKESGNMSGQSKAEYDAALPHLVALVKENFGPNPNMIRITASGHGTINYDTKEQIERHCSVNIENIWGVIV